MSASDFFTSLYASEVGLGVIAARLLVAAVLGGLLGIEREVLARPAGMRTYMLVALAAATFTVVTFELVERARLEGANNVDPIRIIEAVTAGVAFLAAGAIIQARGKIHGVTTGAGLWLAGAIGTACGVGSYPIAALATGLGFIILTLLRSLTGVIPKKASPPAKKDDGEDD